MTFLDCLSLRNGYPMELGQEKRIAMQVTDAVAWRASRGPDLPARRV